MTAGILSTALSGLSAYQQALNTTSNNISNANTAGYSVEQVQFATQTEQQSANGYIGNGVSVATISRSYNQFLNTQVLSSTSAYNSSNTYYTMAKQIDNMIANQSTGLSGSMSAFFNAANTVANSPSSTPARQVLLSDSAALADQFNSINSTFTNINTQVNGNLTASVQELNDWAQTVAKLNVQIVSASNNGTGQAPNGLLDQRDALLNKMSEQANISVVNQSNGSINVFIGQGQPLVLDTSASTLTVQGSPTDSNQIDVMLNGHDISNQITGGQIAGNVQFRSQVLQPAQQQLGLIATGFATAVNNVQAAGVDLNGNQGLPLFVLGAPSAEVQGLYGDPKLQVSANFSAPATASTLAASYQLQVTSTSPNSYMLTNLTTNTAVTGLDDTSLASTAAADGFSIAFSGGSLTSGDSFQISPNYNTAATIQVNPAVTTPAQIAAATSATGLPGDNSNALTLADLQNQKTMNNGTNTFSQAYGQLVTTVGQNTSTAQINSSAQNTVLQNATNAQQSISGVNLNEEAANLIQFQNAYQASAKSISLVQTLFTSILNAVG
ncbi:flagellar hook-associated protein FlgK [Methylomonas sp. AM2-LC]|uniref:flagellar hook-associated protein FlgK n=1 Tax=Methylomonas sp. AM2-LC TaxID=3153301 RepID=UPI00326751D2